MLLSSPDITIVLVVPSVANWLSCGSVAGRIVTAAWMVSSFQGKLHSTVLLETEEGVLEYCQFGGPFTVSTSCILQRQIHMDASNYAGPE